MTFDEFAVARLASALRFATVLTGDPASAEDIVQEVMIRAHKRWAAIGQLDRPDLYLRKMIVNEFVSARRRTWRLIPSGRAADMDTRVTPDHAASLADRAELIAELGKLPRRQRAVIVLRFYEGLPDTSIAELLGTSPVTVRGYAFRALATLRIGLSPAPGHARRAAGQPAHSQSSEEDHPCVPEGTA
jgi:RNA polymerase sigma-70 factor (sigma-E family)